MRNALAIAKKELSIYFTTPWAYVAGTAMVMISAFIFLGWMSTFAEMQAHAREVGWSHVPPEFRNLTDGVVTHLWQGITVLILFIAPLFSMRLFSEEKRQKTFELLMTTPTRPWEIVLGKYLGSLGALGSTLVLTLIFPALLSVYGSSESGHALEWGTVMLGFGALCLWGLACLSVGMFISLFTESQALAALLTVLMLFLWWVVEVPAAKLEEPYRGIVDYIAVGSQLTNLYKGVLDLKTLVFFISVTLLFAIFTHRGLEAHRWT